MRITEQQADWLAEDLQDLLDICNVDEDWYYVQSINKMNDGKYFIFMKSEIYIHSYREIVCDLHFNGENNPLGISNAEFASHGHPCNTEEIYKFEPFV
jgi:hypothetical protein